MRKNILFFAPYGSWILHHQLDAVFAVALKMRGCNTFVIICDKVLNKSCSLSKNTPEMCDNCYKSSMSLFSNYFRLNVIKLSSLLSKEEIEKSLKWSKEIKTEDLPDATYGDGYYLGKWVRSGLCSYFTISNIDLKNKTIERTYRDFINNAAILTHAFNNFYKKQQFDLLLCYNPKHAFYRIFFELTSKNSISVITHERGLIKDSYSFMLNGFEGASGGRVEAFQEWRNVPLTKEECLVVKEDMTNRENCKSFTIPSFYTFTPSSTSDVKKYLRIPSDCKIISIFTGSEWELGMSENVGVALRFSSSIDAFNTFFELFSSENYCFVIRHHPNNIGRGNIEFDFLRKLLILNRNSPPNFRIIMPKERITSYELIWHSDAVISFGSTIGVESLLRGVSVMSTVDTIYSLLQMGIAQFDLRISLKESLMNTITRTKKYTINDLKKIYRGFHFLFYKLSFQFKSFGIKNSFSPYLKIKNQNDLVEGKDPNLDKICNYIIHNTPLLPLPKEADRNRSEIDETKFLEKELEIYKQKRLEVQRRSENNKDFKEPLITVFRIRQDGLSINENPGPQDTILYKTVKKSRQKNIEFNDIAAPYYYDSQRFKEEMEASVKIAKGEYIFFGTDDININESFFSSAVDFLDEKENSLYDGVITGEWIFDSSGKFTGELFTERKNTDDYLESLNAFPLITNPYYLLSFYFWRKTPLKQFISGIGNFHINSFQEFSKILFEKTISKYADFNFYKSLIPNITIFSPPTSKEIIKEGEALYEKKELKKLLKLFNESKIKGIQIPSLNYYRAVLLYNIGNIWPARLAAETQLQENPSDEKTLKFRNEVLLRLDNKKMVFSDIADFINSVDRKLSSEQEQFLFNKVSSLDDNAIIVEIGSRFGASTIPLAYACAGTNKKLFSIDRFTLDTTFNDCYDIWFKNITIFDLENYVTALKGSLAEQLDKLEKKQLQIDFVLIDTSYLYKETIKEFDRVYSLVKDGRYIAFHDSSKVEPLKLWHEKAKHILNAHEYSNNLACGRKDYQVVFEKNNINKISTCSTSIEEVKDLVKHEYFHIRSGFGTLYELLKQKICKISYFGASVTAQKNGYVQSLHKYITDSFNIQHDCFQNGFDDQALEASVALLEKYVVKNKPDLCFIEWTTQPEDFDNDAIVYKYLEAIIYHLRKIKSQICFIYLGFNDKFEVPTKHNTQNAEAFIDLFEYIASYHNIPSINLYKYLQDYQRFLKQHNELDKYKNLFCDFVRTSHVGSYFYGELLFKFFKSMLTSKTKMHHHEKKYLFPDNEFYSV